MKFLKIYSNCILLLKKTLRIFVLPYLHIILNVSNLNDYTEPMLQRFCNTLILSNNDSLTFRILQGIFECVWQTLKIFKNFECIVLYMCYYYAHLLLVAPTSFSLGSCVYDNNKLPVSTYTYATICKNLISADAFLVRVIRCYGCR